MRKQFKTTFFLLLIVLSYNGVAQNLSTNNEGNIKGSSRLNLGISILDWAKSQNLHGFTLGYERFVSGHLSLGVDLYTNVFNKNSYSDFTTTRDFGVFGSIEQNYRNRVSLSFTINYYLKKNSGSGHYFSFIANNTLSLADRVEVSNRPGAFTPSKLDRGIVRSLPVLGIYYGYRKEFKSGFFVDGKIGSSHRISIVPRFKSSNSSLLDLKLSVGWKIDFKKKKGN